MAVLITVQELAEQGHKSADKLYELARRADDPLPLRYIDGERYGAVLVSEFEEWFKRNGDLYRNRKGARNGA